KGLTALQSLDLSSCVQLTDAGLAHLRGLTALRSFYLRWCDWLTDAGLAHLKSLTALQELNLQECKLMGAGAARLRLLLSFLRHSPRRKHLTDIGVSRLRAALPNC